MAFLDNPAAAARNSLEALITAGNQAIADRDGQIASLTAANGDLISKLQGANAQIAADQAEDASETAQTNSIPQPVLVFDNLHLRTDIRKNVGPGIGGQTPSAYSFSQVDNPVPPPNCVANKVLQLDIAGGKFSDWLAFIANTVSLPPQKMRVRLRFKILCDARSLNAVQAIETDSKIIVLSPDGTKNLYDLSFQDFYPSGGMLQLWNPDSGSWFDSGVKIGPFAAMVWRRVAIEYEIDPAIKQYHYISYALDGTKYDLSSSPVRTAKPSSWGVGIDDQLQEDLNGQGGAYTIWFDDLAYEVYVIA